MKIRSAVVVLSLLSMALTTRGSEQGLAKSVRVSDLTPELMNAITKGEVKELIIEFAKGDVIPVNFEMQGDLLETAGSAVTSITVKQSFWLMMVGQSIYLSIDGISYKSVKQALTGNLAVGAASNTSGASASAVNVVLSTLLK